VDPAKIVSGMRRPSTSSSLHPYAPSDPVAGRGGRVLPDVGAGTDKEEGEEGGEEEESGGAVVGEEEEAEEEEEEEESGPEKGELQEYND